MGKKKDKLLAQLKGPVTAQVPWNFIDVDPVGFLVAPESCKDFFSGKWEQTPAVFKATAERAAFFQGLCTFPAIVDWLRQREKKTGPLEFGVDVNAARYKDGVRETPNGDIADAATLQSLHSDDGCTLQLHQPQRFFDPCWRLLAALERQLGCLVGANAYLTPQGSQGLAPHHDDVELWVVQTAGKKKWRLYQPINGYQLPNQPSGDLEQESLGDPILSVELCVGDVLYMPRGTVHQAVADVDANSDHLTISTYQRASFADLATHLLQVGLSSQHEPECLPLAARRSPAPATLLQHSLHKVLAPGTKGSTTPNAVAGLAEALRAIASKLEDRPDMFTSAIHSQAIDFLINRLPPHPKQLASRGPAPSLDDRVWCRVSGWCYLLPFEMTGMSCEEEDGEGFEDGSVKLVSCLTNSREEHMITLPDDDDVDDDDDDDDDDEAEDDNDSRAAEVEEEGSSDCGDDGDDDIGSAEDDAEANGNDREAPRADGHGADDQQQQKATEGSAAATTKKAKKAHSHHHNASGDAAGDTVDHCCSDDGCGAGVHEHSLSSGAAEKDNPVAALPGLVLAPAMVKAVVMFMGAETREQAVAIRDLPLPSDAQKLQLAFALWAEGLAASVPEQQQQGNKQPKAGVKQQHRHSDRKQKKKRPADASAAAIGSEGGDDEHTATSSGRARPSKKTKT